MDVKIEGENAARHLDIGTHNHGSTPGNSPPWNFLAKNKPPRPEDESKCQLRPYNPNTCPKGTTPHQCVPDHCFREPGKGGARYKGAISRGKGLCVCVTGAGKSDDTSGGHASAGDFASVKDHYLDLAEHGRIHMVFDALEAKLGAQGNPPNSATLGDLEDAAAKVIAVVTGCKPSELKNQLREHHDGCKMSEDWRCRADPHGQLEAPDFDDLGSLTKIGGK
jgi:hypothetical protein